MKSLKKTNIHCDNKWINDLVVYEENREWRVLSEKFALAIMRLLRHQNKNQLWLSKKLDKSPQYVSRVIKGKENLSLKSMVLIQSIFDTEIISIKNIDLATKYKDSFIYFLEKQDTEEHIENFELINNTHSFISGHYVSYINMKSVIEKSIEEYSYQPIEEDCL